MSYQPRYDKGDWKAVCDSCGRIFKASTLRKRWDGLMVCRDDYETRQPQDFVRGKADIQAPVWTKPETSDSFIFSPPLAPTIGTITAKTSTTATVSFTPPATYTLPIDSYILSAASGETATGTDSPLTVTGLTPATQYSFSVQTVDRIPQNSVASDAVIGCTLFTIPTPVDYGITLGTTPSATPWDVPVPLVSYGVVDTTLCGEELRKETTVTYSERIVYLLGNLTDATYNGHNFSVVTQTTASYKTKFSPDGYTMYVSDGQHHAVLQYSLSVAGDISSAVYSKTTGNKFSATADGLSQCNFYGFDISDDGTKVVAVGTYDSNPYAFMFSLSVPWQMDSISTYAVTKIASDPTKLLIGITLGKSGTRMYLMSTSSLHVLQQYNLSVADDITSATNSGKTLSLGSGGDPCYGITFSLDGLRSYHVQQTSATLFRKVFSTAWELDSASASQSKVVSVQDAAPRGVSINTDETIVYVTGAATQKIYEYSMLEIPSYYLDTHTTELHYQT